MGYKQLVIVLSPVIGALLLWSILALALGISHPFYIVEGRSMEPTLHDGDLVVVRKADVKDVKIGDIIVFYEPKTRSKIIIHRVIGRVEVRGQVFLRTKGDNNSKPDPWLVSDEDLIGVVVGGSRPFRLPFVGKAILFLRSPIGLFLLTALYVFFIYEAFKKEGGAGRGEGVRG